MVVKQCTRIVYQDIDRVSFCKEAVDQYVGILQETQISEFKLNVGSARGLFDGLCGLRGLDLISDDQRQ